MPTAKDHRTVTRVTTILEIVAGAKDGMRLGDLAEAIDAPRSSVHALANGLLANGYLVQDDGRYVIGPAVGALLRPRQPVLLEIARPVMERLVKEVDETVALCGLVGSSVVYLDLVESSRPIRYVAPLRERRPLYPTSAGKCFLAFMESSVRERHLAGLPEEVRDRARIELAAVRRDRLAVNRGETVPDVAAVASPIVVGRRAVACFNVAGPMPRVLEHFERTSSALRAATRGIEEEMT